MARGLLFAGSLFFAAAAGGWALLSSQGAGIPAWGLVASAMLVAYALTPVMGGVARRVDAIDRPGGRKVHPKPTPLLGGAAIYAGFTLAVLAGFGLSSKGESLLLAGSVIFLLGAIEDARGVPAIARLGVQVVAVVVLVRAGISITFLPPTWWGIACEWALTVLWIVGVTNAFNFLDGLDGLATGSAAIHAFFMGFYAATTGQAELAFLSFCLMGGALGFLPHNYKPHRRGASAEIFLGDCGSTFLGFMLASLAVMGDWAEHSPKDLIVPVLILAVPIFDMVLTTVVRIADGSVRSFVEWILYTGRDHFHHRLLGIGMRNQEAVAIIYLLNVCLGLSAFLLKGTATSDAFLVLLQVAIVFGILGYGLVIMDRRSKVAGRARGESPTPVSHEASASEDIS